MDNPYAFPRVRSELPDGVVLYGQSGMSLRDYFAGQALIGMMGNITCPKERLEMRRNANSIATQAYDIADAMLTQRPSTEDQII